MFIVNEYYPETNSTTGADGGYDWTPRIQGGWYIFKDWGVRGIVSGGFEYFLKSVSPAPVWSFTGGPFIEDPYEPTAPIPEPVPLPSVTFTQLTVYVNGVSAAVVDYNLDLADTIPGITAPLIIGPI